MLRRLLVEPARPRSIAARPNAHWLVVATVCIGAFMGQLDASIVTVAFPTLRHAFHATLGGVQWVGLTYLVVLVSTVAVVGRIADGIGRKLLYTYGFIVFSAGSAACGFAPNLLSLDALRGVQALGAAMLQANSIAIIAVAMPRGTLGRAIGVQGAAQALGLSLGPAFGGALITLGGWRLLFFVNVPIGVVGMVASWYLIPRSRSLQPREPFDRLGVALLVPTLSALLFTISFGNELGWASPLVVALLASSALLGVGFALRERRAHAPIFDVALFTRPEFSTGVASGMLSYVVLFGFLFAAPFFLEGELGFSPGGTGALLTAVAVGLGVVAPFAGQVSDRVGAAAPTVFGMSVASLALLLLAGFHRNTTALVAELALLGAGLGAFMPANNARVMGVTPLGQSGAVSGIINLSRGLGTSLGLAVAGLVLGIVAGNRARPELMGQGFTAVVLVLAGVALVAAVLAGSGGGGRAQRSGSSP